MNEAIKIVEGPTLCQACKQREEGEGITNITFSSINAKSFTSVCF